MEWKEYIYIYIYIYQSKQERDTIPLRPSPTYVQEYRKTKGVKIWCVGAVSLCNKESLDMGHGSCYSVNGCPLNYFKKIFMKKKKKEVRIKLVSTLKTIVNRLF